MLNRLKFWVALLFAAGTAIEQVADIPQSVLKWITIGTAILGAISVYLVPNVPLSSNRLSLTGSTPPLPPGDLRKLFDGLAGVWEKLPPPSQPPPKE